MLTTVPNEREKLEITAHYEDKIIHKMTDVTSDGKLAPVPTYQ